MDFLTSNQRVSLNEAFKVLKRELKHFRKSSLSVRLLIISNMNERFFYNIPVFSFVLSRVIEPINRFYDSGFKFKF
uniref:Uncharacterized protein n=1 Tax=Daphnia magna TaxID=35525 RepID=A0A0P4Y9U7_9CRUS